MNSKIPIPHSIFRNAFAVAEKMEPLKSKKDPAIAAICGFFTGGIGLGLYCQSLQDFLIPWGMLVFLMVIGMPIAELPAFFVPVFWGIYAWKRVKASNAKLEGRGKGAIVEAEIITEPSTIGGLQQTGQVQSRLRRLDDLLAEGILSPSEHATKRAQLLNN